VCRWNSAQTIALRPIMPMSRPFRQCTVAFTHPTSSPSPIKRSSEVQILWYNPLLRRPTQPRLSAPTALRRAVTRCVPAKHASRHSTTVRAPAATPLLPSPPPPQLPLQPLRALRSRPRRLPVRALSLRAACPLPVVETARTPKCISTISPAATNARAAGVFPRQIRGKDCRRCWQL
jgi:hypothetical protein